MLITGFPARAVRAEASIHAPRGRRLRHNTGPGTTAPPPKRNAVTSHVRNSCVTV